MGDVMIVALSLLFLFMLLVTRIYAVQIRNPVYPGAVCGLTHTDGQTLANTVKEADHNLTAARILPTALLLS